jgi:hypothetical protein
MCSTGVDSSYNRISPGVIMLSNGNVVDLQYHTCASESTIADVNHDGFADVLTHAGTGFQVYNVNGTLVSQANASNYGLWTVDGNPQPAGAPVIGRFEQGGYNGLFFIIRTTNSGIDSYRVFFANANGTLIATYNFGAEMVYSQSSAVDIDSNGIDEVVVATSDALRMLRADASVVWTAPSCSNPMVGNISGDDSLQVICVRASGSDSVIDAYDARDGHHISGYPLIIPNVTIRGPIITAKLAATHTTNDLLVPTTKGLKAYRGSDLQNIWTIQDTLWCDNAKVHSYGDGVVLIA